MKWIKKFSRDFERDKLRIEYSRLNWNYLKPQIKQKLDSLAEELQQNGIDVFTYDYAEKGDKTGFDGLNMQFRDHFTRNRTIDKDNDKFKLFKPHKQKGGNLAILYNETGAINVMILPSTSEDSLAEHDHIIIDYTYNASTITPDKIEKYVKAFLRYHRYTGVLHKTTLADKLIISWLKIKMFWIEYLNPDEVYKRYSGLYIPALSLIVGFVAMIISLMALVISLKN